MIAWFALLFLTIFLIFSFVLSFSSLAQARPEFLKPFPPSFRPSQLHDDRLVCAFILDYFPDWPGHGCAAPCTYQGTCLRQNLDRSTRIFFLQAALAKRLPEGFATIPVYVRREILKRQTKPAEDMGAREVPDDGDLAPRQLPEELPTTSVDGIIKEYGTRDFVARQLPEGVTVGQVVARQLPEEVATTSVDGVIKEYGARDLVARQLPEELPTSSVDGVIKEYGARDLVARQEIPAEVATTSVNGAIKVYDGTF
jgi:hypothetical protein